MKRVIVTGGTGFIGRHCVEPLINHGFEVHVVDINLPSDGPKNVQFHKIDLLASQSVRNLVSDLNATHLLHLAWFNKPREYWDSLQNLRWLEASLGLLQAFAESGGSRAVMAGTCAEYDWNYGYCSETLTPLAPRTLYGACKHSLNLVSSELANQLEVSYAWGRIFFLFGPHENPARLVPYVISSLLSGQEARCTQGSQIRDFLYVKDVADAFAALLDREEVTGAVNIASGRPLALKDLICRIAEKLNQETLVRLGAIPTPSGEPELIVGDNNRLRNDVGWRSQYDMENALEETIEWHRREMERSANI